MKRYFFIITLFFVSSLFAKGDPEYLKKQMLSNLDFIKTSFEVKYGPSLWKKDYAAWSVEKAYKEAREKVLKLQKPTVKDYQIILKEFFQSPKDYHVSALFYSTEAAYLPFTVKSANKRYFVVHVDNSQANLTVGDEILSFNGVPIDTVVTQLRKKEIGDNVKETDQAMAELILTVRLGVLGHVVPKGNVDLVVRRLGSDKEDLVKLTWVYNEERIHDFGKPKAYTMQFPSAEHGEPKDAKALFNKMMISPAFFMSEMKAHRDNPHQLGSKKSFIPVLGKKSWESGKESCFDAYIFSIKDKTILPAGKDELRIGYVRIPHYGSDEREANEFAKIISRFEGSTDAVVIDQINNPGGSVFYAYALASMLADKPLVPPKHRIALTQEEIHDCYMLINFLSQVRDDFTAKLVFGETIGGYPVDYQFIVATRAFCYHLINEWEEGRLYTQPIHLFGVDVIRPHPKVHYTNPILVVMNSLCISCGDFFPAIMQDGQRATLLGSRTAGAGGFVLGHVYPNVIGVRGFYMTGSLAYRANQQPIENLGVKPDIEYVLSEQDLQDNYKSYTKKILESVCDLCKEK